MFIRDCIPTEEMESRDALGFWAWAAGVVVGVVVCGAVAIGTGAVVIAT